MEMASTLVPTSTTAAVRPAGVLYAVGVRVFTDRQLLRQIRSEIVRNGMRPEQIAALENVTPEVLIELLDEGLADDPSSGAQLRELARRRSGWRVGAWRTTRQHPSKLHILDAGGIALCGTPRGGALGLVHSGPCLTCAAHARLQLSALPRAA
jgi:hypothetical protein